MTMNHGLALKIHVSVSKHNTTLTWSLGPRLLGLSVASLKESKCVFLCGTA